MEKRYYDPEYDRVIGESEIRKQFEWFKQQSWFHKSYEQFKTDNFCEIEAEWHGAVTVVAASGETRPC